ncbi:MAG: hypothetical protein AB8G16_02605 [Gammaproteobacteria bacterium]
MNDNIQQGRGRRQLIMLTALFLGPVILAAAFYFFGVDLRPKGSVAHGELISPVVTLPVADQDATFRGGWTLAVVAEACETPCAETLVKVRQVRLALGREMERIERVLLVTGDQPISAELRGAHPGLRVIDDNEPELLALASQFPGDQAGSLYLIDPLGNLMMRFERDVEPKFLKKDIKRLLKLSSIG